MKITDPTGITWRVRRRWLPWRLGPNPGPMASDLRFYPAQVAETVLDALLLPVFVLLRVLRVIGWPVQTWRGDELRYTQSVRGWAASRAYLLSVADAVSSGVPPKSARRPVDDGGTP